MDAVYQNFEISRKKAGILHHLGITKNDYFLATVHRQENVDNKETVSRNLERLADD